MCEVGDELKVQSVFTGSVTPQGDGLRVNVELDDIRDGKSCGANSTIASRPNCWRYRMTSPVRFLNG